MLEFAPVAEDFSATMEALREFIASLGPVLLQREKELWKNAEPLLSRFGAAVLLTGGELGSGRNLSEELKAKIEELNSLIAEVEKNPQFSGKISEILTKNLPIRYVDGKPEVDWNVPEAAEIMPATRAMTAAKKQLRLLHDSALMALTSRSEWFIAQLLHLYFSKHPSAAGMSEPFFSLDALASLQTIDEAKGVLLEHKVESLMREPLEEWLKFFRDKPKLGMGYLANEVGRMSEIFKRRNLVVHNGGRANRRYFKEVEEALRPGIELGVVIEVSADYLNASIDLLEHQFLLIAAELWKYLEPSDERRGQFLSNVAVHCLNEKRWATAQGLSRFGMNDKNLPETLRLYSQVNYWQSFKWAGQYDEIREEVQKIDFSAKAPIYGLAHAALVDDFELCFKLIPDLLEHQDIKKLHLNTWPLFQNLRGRPEFSLYKMTDEDKSQQADAKSDGDASPAGPTVN
jgi:hypothetical protein